MGIECNLNDFLEEKVNNVIWHDWWHTRDEIFWTLTLYFWQFLDSLKKLIKNPKEVIKLKNKNKMVKWK